MIKNITKLFNATAALVIGSLVLWSCEPDADSLGSQFFQNGAEGIVEEYPVIAYNAYNEKDSIRTDAVRLQNATLGAFSEPQFGMQKSDYVTQVRLSSYAPDFGTNPVLDSAVLVIKPTYPTDSATTTTTENYIYPDGNIESKKVVSTYPVAKYGKAKIGGKTIFNIKVHEVTEFLAANTDKVFSDRRVTTGNLLGTKVFDGQINSIKITQNSNNTVLYEREVSLRMPLDNAFFQNNIVLKAKSPELADVASFIRFFKGIKISVEENDGYILSFNPNTVAINLYYKKDKVDGSTTTREQDIFTLNLGSGNTHFNQITSIRETPFANAIATSNQTTGDAKLFAQGMGGPGIGLRVPAPTVNAIKDLYNNKKIGIISAKIRLYTDKTSWDNNYEKPASFTVWQREIKTGNTYEDLGAFLTDISDLAYTGVYKLVKTNDLDKNPASYDIGITKTFKDIVEKNADNHDIILNVGTYTLDSNGNLVGLSYPKYAQNYNTRTYTPNRAVFVGTDSGNVNSAKLILTYGKK